MSKFRKVYASLSKSNQKRRGLTIREYIYYFEGNEKSINGCFHSINNDVIVNVKSTIDSSIKAIENNKVPTCTIVIISCSFYTRPSNIMQDNVRRHISNSNITLSINSSNSVSFFHGAIRKNSDMASQILIATRAS